MQPGSCFESEDDDEEDDSSKELDKSSSSLETGPSSSGAANTESFRLPQSSMKQAGEEQHAALQLPAKQLEKGRNAATAHAPWRRACQPFPAWVQPTMPRLEGGQVGTHMATTKHRCLS
jgi:hypothetical protein